MMIKLLILNLIIFPLKNRNITVICLILFLIKIVTYLTHNLIICSIKFSL